MLEYFIKRLALVPVTLIGITFLVFSVTRFVPGGAVDRMLQQAAQASKASDNELKLTASNSSGLSEEQLEQLEEIYGLNENLVKAYLQWLGASPRKINISKFNLNPAENKEQRFFLNVFNGWVLLDPQASKLSSQDSNRSLVSHWKWRIEDEQQRKLNYVRKNGGEIENAPNYAPRLIVYQQKYAGLLQGNFGHSIVYGDSVIELIWKRIPIALYFGLLTAIITYGISIPLGIIKALKHQTWFDDFSSILIFLGYSTPSFALGIVLLVFLGVQQEWFPLFGLVSANFEELSLIDKVLDIGRHTVLPLICYVIGGFAVITLLVKNSLMEQMSSDYIRTAVAKGLSYRKAVIKHALRNSLMPIASTLGDLITIFIGGSLLIERVFDIEGFGLLQFQAVLERDVPVIMGTLTISAGLMLLGNVLSDLIVATVDPRIKFK